jgi:adenylosuccinate synthase
MKSKVDVVLGLQWGDEEKENWLILSHQIMI